MANHFGKKDTLQDVIERVPRKPGAKERFLLTRMQALFGDDFHPIIKMAENCLDLQKVVDEKKKTLELMEREDCVLTVKQMAYAIGSLNQAIKDANTEWSRIAEYTEPKLKSIELNPLDGNDPNDLPSLTDLFVIVDNDKPVV